MEKKTTSDEVWDLRKCSQHLKMNSDRTRRIIASAGIAPVRTAYGTGYSSDQVQDLAERVFRKQSGKDAL